MKKSTLLSIIIFQFFIIGLNSQTLEWNTLGSGDKTDLYSEQNYMDASTGQVPVENTINGDTEINRDVSIRSGVVGGENGASLTLKTGIGGLTVENATLKMNSAENAGIDLGVGNTSFIISNATVKTQFVHNATIIMEGRSQLTLDGDESCLDNTTIELRSPDAFVVFTNIRPSVSNLTLESKITGNILYTNGNLRLSQHYAGSNIRALPKENQALYVFGGKDQSSNLGSFSDGFYGKIGINSGLTVESADSYSITGFGDGISGSEDMFHFAYRKLSGNGELIARCDSVENNNAQTKAGLMIRSSLAIDAPFVMALMNPDNTVFAMTRENEGSNTINLTSATGETTSAKYLRVVRQDNQFSAYYSASGATGPWIQLGETKSINMGQDVYFGLARSSAEGSLGAKAHFSQVSIMQDGVPVAASNQGVFEAHADVFKPCPFEDQISSFILKQGYELCMSSDGAGQGYSQVWVATEGDVFINLPEQLDKKNSFFRIVPWRWTSKKGTGGGDGKELLSAQWKYEWEPTGNSTANVEFVPMIKGRSQNKDYRWEQVRKRGRQTHMLGFNEPMANKQGDLTVDEAIDLWPKEQMMGLRLGSPARTDGSNGDDWLKEFMEKAEAKGYRVDYVCVHCYNKNNATGLYNFLFTEYMKYGKPIWLTEFNSELTTLAAQEKYITEVTKMMEEAPFVERYAYFNSSEHKNFFNEDRTALSPLGEIYRDVKSNPAYVSPDYGKWLGVDLSANVTTDRLSANVAFSVGNSVIESVEYFINGISAGSTSTAPFSLLPIAISDKLVSVRAVAKTVFGEQQSSNTVQLINQATGLNDAVTSIIKLYPNPFNDKLFLSESAKWNVIDLQGKNIISGYGNEIKTTGLSNGMYIISLNNEHYKIMKSEHKTK